ncbi:MAG: thioredoxin [Oscillospiraceae bacterium]|nr:thioredoxin [Oscillospiraceae bacterium]
MAEITITATNFEDEVLKSDVPVLLDFWASWCGPCRMLAPVIAEIAEEQAGKIKVGKINVDEEPVLASAFKVSIIPTVVVMKDGKVTNVSVGFRPKADIEALLN